MAVERVDYYSDDEYERALVQQAQEPDVVSCFCCGYPMYEEYSDPNGNICSICREERENGQTNR